MLAPCVAIKKAVSKAQNEAGLACATWHLRSRAVEQAIAAPATVSAGEHYSCQGLQALLPARYTALLRWRDAARASSAPSANRSQGQA